MRAVVDTNVWVSAFLNPLGLPSQVESALQDGRFSLLMSEPLLAELSDVLSRLRLVRRHRRSPEQIAAFVEALRRDSESVLLTGTVHVCRDPDDDAVIETAILGGALYVVSGDQDTQAREVVEYLAVAGIRVVTVREFLTELEAEEALEQPEGDAGATA